MTKNGDAAEQGPHGAGEPGEPIRVLVADDHVLYRRGLQLVLGQEPDIAIVGEAADGVEAIRRTEELLPDVVLMDVRMPRTSIRTTSGNSSSDRKSTRLNSSH